VRWARRAGPLIVAWEPVNPGLARGLRTPSFSVSRSARATLLTHRLGAAQIDNDLGDRIASELVRPGLVSDFEAAFAGVVACTAADPLAAWERFYARTLTGLVDESRAGTGAIATFGAIYRHALGLVVGDSLLDTGSCFGFLCLLAAERGLQTTGTDACAATIALAARVAARRGSPASFQRADVRERLPARADTVSALHLLEHLAPGDVDRALARLCAAARRRVIVAVPLERRPDPTYGHRGAFELATLRSHGARVPGWRATVHEHRGGWLVLDRAPARKHLGDGRLADGRRAQSRTFAHDAGAARAGKQHARAGGPLIQEVRVELGEQPVGPRRDQTDELAT